MKQFLNLMSRGPLALSLAVCICEAAAAESFPPVEASSIAVESALEGAGSQDSKPAATTKKRQVFILPLDGMVGVGLRHDEMEQIEKIADTFGSGQIIILRINSNGGYVTEGDMIAESLTRIKSKHRLVAWVEKAISGGAFTALYADEMYFMPEAALGSITMLAGGTEVVAVREDWKERVAQACQMGDRDPLIGPAMVHSEVELSYDREGDKVTFYNSMKGKYPLSTKDENLDFSAASAEHCKFSDGTAATEADLLKELGLDDETKFELNDAGKVIAAKWQKLIKGAKEEVPLLLQKRGIEGTSQGQIGFLQARIRNTQKIIDWYKKCRPALETDFGIRKPVIEQFEAEIKEMRKQIKELQAAGGG